MTNRTLIILFALATILGCQVADIKSTPREIVDIELSQLDDYWIEVPTRMKTFDGRPKFIPPGRGQGFYTVTIDSNGEVVSKNLVRSVPEGWMTQKHLDHMPTKTYVASKSNPEKLAVRVELSFAVMPRSEIGSTTE